MMPRADASPMMTRTDILITASRRRTQSLDCSSVTHVLFKGRRC
jgi:hypothetical protein